MLRAISNRSWRQHLTKQQLHGHLPPIMKTIQIRWTWHARHCWRSGDKLISDGPHSHGQAKAGRPARTYIQQFCEDMECSPENLPEEMNDRERWRERARDIRADGTRRWWWCSAEQNNKTSLKNNNEWFIFMKVDLCQSEKRFFSGIRYQCRR